MFRNTTAPCHTRNKFPYLHKTAPRVTARVVAFAAMPSKRRHPSAGTAGRGASAGTDSRGGASAGTASQGAPAQGKRPRSNKVPLTSYGTPKGKKIICGKLPYFQSQVELQCAVHAVNNLYGGDLFDFDETVQRLEQHAQQEAKKNPWMVVVGDNRPFASADGVRTEAMAWLLQGTASYGFASIESVLDAGDRVGFIFELGKPGTSEGHWTSARYLDNGNYLYLESLGSKCVETTPEGLRQFLQERRDDKWTVVLFDVIRGVPSHAKRARDKKRRVRKGGRDAQQPEAVEAAEADGFGYLHPPNGRLDTQDVLKWVAGGLSSNSRPLCTERNPIATDADEDALDLTAP